ncbi:MAG: hypothetical protein GY869_15010 [Planctomycetes bacterium]|nr:hypothetical protein [Planctomycetota bacterium]
MTNKQKKSNPAWNRGTTLPEMLVAVAITVGMLMISGMIFSSATTATGKAAANTDIIQQHRTMTHQLETDIKGLRNDMPLAIIFESYLFDPDSSPLVTGDEYPVRSDRIFFFANGNYQNLYGFSGNAARIFYGQSDRALDAFPAPPDSLPVPPRRILTRRWKMLTPNSPWPQTVADWLSPPINGIPTLPAYDSYTTENATLSQWKTTSYIDYTNSYFREDLSISLIRRPSVKQMAAAAADYRDIQSIYMLPDVTNLKIQFWYFDNNLGKWRWFPTQDDLDPLFYNEILDRYSLGTLTTGNFALAWNINGIFPANTEQFDYINGAAMLPWISLPPGHILQDSAAINVLDAPLPRALKFTYTLHDKNRSRFPEGQTFSYIIKLPN